MKIAFTLNHALLILAASLLGTLPAQAQSKIATISLQKVFDGYWKTKQADAQLKERAAEFDKQNKGFLDDYKKANEDYKKALDSANDQAVSAAEREKRKKAAEAKLLESQDIEKQIMQFGQSARSQLGDTQRNMRQKILDEIKEIIDTKAKASGYFLVVDTAAQSANQTPIILYTNGDNDLSDDVLKELNSKAPVDLLKTPDEKSAPTAPAKKDDKPAPSVPAKKDGKK